MFYFKTRRDATRVGGTITQQPRVTNKNCEQQNNKQIDVYTKKKYGIERKKEKSYNYFLININISLPCQKK